MGREKCDESEQMGSSHVNRTEFAGSPASAVVIASSTNRFSSANPLRDLTENGHERGGALVRRRFGLDNARDRIKFPRQEDDDIVKRDDAGEVTVLDDG